MAKKNTNELLALVTSESTRQYDPINKVNPATSVIYIEGKPEPIKSQAGFFKSRMEAEYGAIEYLLEQAVANKQTATIRVTDMNLVKQLSGEYKVTKPSLVQYREKVWNLMKTLGDKVHLYFHVDIQPKEEVEAAADVNKAFGQ